MQNKVKVPCISVLKRTQAATHRKTTPQQDLTIRLDRQWDLFDLEMPKEDRFQQYQCYQ